MKAVIRLENPYLDFSDCADLDAINCRIRERFAQIDRRQRRAEDWAREAIRKLHRFPPGSEEYEECLKAIESEGAYIVHERQQLRAESLALLRIMMLIGGVRPNELPRWTN